MMSVEVVVPTFGESVFEAVVGRWLKQEGDEVAAGDAVVELETEKVNTQVTAPVAGVLKGIRFSEGSTVRPGDLLTEIDERPGARERNAGGGPRDQAEAPRMQPVERPRVSPVAQRLAEELAIDLSRVQGSGPAGRIMKEDVQSMARQENPSPAAPSQPAVGETIPVSPATGDHRETRQTLSRRRLTIARRLVEAQQTAAMLTTFNEIDMHAVVELRRRRREAFRAATGADLGFMSFFVRATVGALKAYPRLNAELAGDDLILKHYYDLGIAIGDPEGLIVPVLREADRLSFAQIEQGVAALVEKAKTRTLSLDDLRGGTFTITNGGVFGSLFSTPILNPPQVGILGMHKISERPVVVGGQVTIRPMMFVALTYDHRIVDGREAVLFLVRIKELIEDPERLLLES